MMFAHELLSNASAPGEGLRFETPLGDVTRASLQADWQGDGNVAILVRGRLGGNTDALIAALDTQQGYVKGEIVTFALPVGLKSVVAEVKALSGSATGLWLYFRAQ